MKNKIISILLVFSVGFIGIHRFYLNKPKIGLILLFLFISFFILMLMGINNIAAITLVALIVGWIYEIYLVITGKLNAKSTSDVEIATNKIQNKNVKSFEINDEVDPLTTKNNRKVAASTGFKNFKVTMEKVDKKSQNKEKEKKSDIINFDEKKRKRKDLKDQSFKLYEWFSDEEGKKWLAENEGKLFFQESGSSLLQEQAYDYIDVAIEFAHIDELNPEIKKMIWGKKKPKPIGENDGELLMHIKMTSNFVGKQPSLFNRDVAPEANKDVWWEWLDDCTSELFAEYLRIRSEKSDDVEIKEYIEENGYSPNSATKVYTFNGKIFGKYSWQGGNDFLIDKDSDTDYNKSIVISQDENSTHGFSSKLVDFNYGYSLHKIEDFKKLNDKETRSIFLDLEEGRHSNPALIFNENNSSEIFKSFSNTKISGVNNNLFLNQFFQNPLACFSEAKLVYSKNDLDDDHLMAIYFKIFNDAYYFETDLNGGVKNQEFKFIEMLAENNKLPIKLENESAIKNLILLDAPTIQLDYSNKISNQGIAIITKNYSFVWEFKSGTDHFDLENYDCIKSILSKI